MKNIPFFLLLIVFIFVSSISCDSFDSGSSKSDKPLGGTISSFGEVGTTFSSTYVPSVLKNPVMKVTQLVDGVSTIELSADISEEDMNTIIEKLPLYNGKTSAKGNYRVTSKGIQSVYDDGTIFTLVEYDAKVGDKYTATRNGNKVEREVIAKSTEDEYYWGGMWIKTITVEETGRNIPGVLSVEMDFNHKFGFVGYKVNFEDGTNLMTNIDNSTY